MKAHRLLSKQCIVNQMQNDTVPVPDGVVGLSYYSALDVLPLGNEMYPASTVLTVALPCTSNVYL